MLFDSILYGPIHSRRLGISLGINLMPTTHKLCTFDCVYCECGWNTPVSHPVLPDVEEYEHALERKLQALLQEGVTPDVITFSGNGEPTLHPRFADIMRITVRLRNHYFPTAKISVLSNSTQLGREDVVEALKLADNRILKLDSGIDETMRHIDQPVNKALTVAQIVEWLRPFDGDFILQTCFLRGQHRGQVIDNTTPEELSAWYQMVEQLHPQQVMIYVIDRQTPCPTLEKISREEMERIAAPLRERGYSVSVSA